MQVNLLSVGPLAVNCYLLEDENGHAVLIDPGAEPQRILRLVRERELTVDAILLTHGHFDHIGAVEALRFALDAPVWIHELDAELLSDPQKNASLLFSDTPVTAVFDQLLQDEMTLSFGELEIHVLHTPGHSKGSVCFLTGDLLFTGDTLFAGSIGRTDFYGGDLSTLRKSLERLRLLTDDYRIYPGHGAGSTLLREKTENFYLVESYDDLF